VGAALPFRGVRAPRWLRAGGRGGRRVGAWRDGGVAGCALVAALSRWRGGCSLLRVACGRVVVEGLVLVARPRWRCVPGRVCGSWWGRGVAGRWWGRG